MVGEEHDVVSQLESGKVDNFKMNDPVSHNFAHDVQA